jgi:hypothetical protein
MKLIIEKRYRLSSFLEPSARHFVAVGDNPRNIKNIFQPIYWRHSMLCYNAQGFTLYFFDELMS